MTYCFLIPVFRDVNLESLEYELYASRSFDAPYDLPPTVAVAFLEGMQFGFSLKPDSTRFPASSTLQRHHSLLSIGQGTAV